ncbi:glycoside hydrolase family 19 protein [Pantoea agglomerans]|uniref:glycoside hydrolase family 19 protein n=1 Tax=Enterobacter agglomerans TaxID=549 RepID=UPI003C7A29A0
MSVIPEFSWPVPSNNRGSDFASQEDLMSHMEGEATGWFMLGSNGMWHGGIHITSITTPWCALSGKTASELLDFPVPYRGEQSVRCMADGEVVAYRICRNYLAVPWETGPLNFSGSFVLVRHYIQPGEKKESSLHFYTLYMHLAPYTAYASSEHETQWIVNDKLPVFRRGWVPDANSGNRNTYRIATLPKGSQIEWDASDSGCSATGPRARRYGLVTFRGLSDEAKLKGTKTRLEEGQQYWILTDRDNLVPSSGTAARPSWWAHLLPPFAEPMQFDTVVCPTPYPISAGDSVGHLGYFQVPKDGGYDVRYQVHIECLSADDALPTFLTNPEKVGETLPLYLKCPSGLALFSKDLKTKAMVSNGRVSQGEAILKLGQVKTEKDAQEQDYWFLPYANGYVPKSNASVETLSQYDLDKLGFTTTVDEAPGFDHLDGTTPPAGLVRTLYDRLLKASSNDTRVSHRAVPHNYQRLLNRIDSRVSPYSSQEYLSAIHNPSYRDVKNKMIVKHPSEWYHKKDTSIWQSFLNKLTSDAPEWREYCEDYLDKMVWMQDASKLKLDSSFWHMHPVVFLGALLSKNEIITLEMLLASNLGQNKIQCETVLPYINKYAKAYGMSDCKEIAHFLSQIGHESGFSITEENLNYSAKGMRRIFGCIKGPSQYNNSTDDCNLGRLRTKLWSNESTYAHNPENLANYVYASRMGNDNEFSGDGYKYRGRGMIQLTGKEGYKYFTTKHNEMSPDDSKDFVSSPGLVISEIEYGVESAFSFWLSKKLNVKAKNSTVYEVTGIVNGGQNGYDDRLARFNAVAPLLGVNKE